MRVPTSVTNIDNGVWPENLGRGLRNQPWAFSLLPNTRSAFFITRATRKARSVSTWLRLADSDLRRAIVRFGTTRRSISSSDSMGFHADCSVFKDKRFVFPCATSDWARARVSCRLAFTFHVQLASAMLSVLQTIWHRVAKISSSAFALVYSLREAV
jgi:hypothetical protein